jgi:hypothetical protein
VSGRLDVAAYVVFLPPTLGSSWIVSPPTALFVKTKRIIIPRKREGKKWKERERKEKECDGNKKLT